MRVNIAKQHKVQIAKRPVLVRFSMAKTLLIIGNANIMWILDNINGKKKTDLCEYKN